jgi:ATP-binding cassette subfamily C (CFTR/MRP) protein 1
MVCGPVGSGKSSLLCAILGDMRKESGDVELHGKVAYVAQQAWIVNATLKENILFGSPYDQDKYEKVIQVCALSRDIEILPAGDATEIGEKGINLSGGQKARVSLARACYQDADVYLLDDPLSAVDVHVSKTLFDDCVKGYLAGKTIVLVTHQIQYLPRANHIAVIDNARISAYGTFEEISRTHPHLQTELGVKPTASGTSESSAAPTENGSDKAGKAPAGKPGQKDIPNKVQAQPSSLSTAEKGKTTTNETRNKGNVQMQIWVSYAKAMGIAISVYLICAYVLSQGLQLASDWQLSNWSSAVAAFENAMGEYTQEAKEAKDLGKSLPEKPEPVNTTRYLGIYTIITIFAAASVAMRGFFCMLGTIRSAVILHDGMLETLMRAPVRFFDTTPTGRILNRFSSDQYTVDNELRQTIQMLLMCFIRVLFVSFVILYVTPIFIVCVLPLGFIYHFVQK